ncbi:cytochrome b5-like heme/steroid binding domain-containing protein [Protomyces lactucae-debilis]|uniref:Cytochrome b5-like heme/steroid binding domain-containing protein n=1 Tax=Protomyces lactucae-debilis TaxID=2754530 RepID=A0A1Y2F308_PROLT|nr:cytochrome b5-like heme/steroid binding domain-containing protein [Protomyces lactucae-debilis]ORY78252.1 cytochrome b5-like heme/steroid binding domain-containing protein [Protomyces lactucae-debilis]
MSAKPEAVVEVKPLFTFTNVILIAVLLYFLYARFKGKSGLPSLQKPIEPLPRQDYTPQELTRYNGVGDPHILIAIKGKVYDVTTGYMFYGPKGPYKNFGGHDASRALACGSFEPEMFVSIDGPIDKLEDLDDEQKQSLEDWVSHFDMKYIDAGRLLENGSKKSD